MRLRVQVESGLHILRSINAALIPSPYFDRKADCSDLEG